MSTTNDYNKGKKFHELSSLEKSKEIVQVVRDGKKHKINIDEIVVGDLVVLRMGMEIVGDGVLIQGNGVKVDESSMTGETRLVSKQTVVKSMIERERIWQLQEARQ